MKRASYVLFSEGRIGDTVLRNRIVRSATYDPPVARQSVVASALPEFYREIAKGGVGSIITGLVPVVFREDEKSSQMNAIYCYERVAGYDRIAKAVHGADDRCKVFVQLYGGSLIGPSEMESPRWGTTIAPLSIEQIGLVEDCYVSAIVHMKSAGFDGVQLHAAFLHNCLSYFLSPHCNLREDEYGGTPENRARIVKNIVTKARKCVGSFPIIIKLNGTDNLENGMNIEQFPEMAQEIQASGVDAIEISGMPYAPRHMGEKLAPYFCDWAARVDVQCPVVLVGGIRNAEDAERMLQAGSVDFIGLCRPLICEPDLPNRWLAGRGSDNADCISCSSCQYSVRQMGLDHAVCLYKHDKENHKLAQQKYEEWHG